MAIKLTEIFGSGSRESGNLNRGFPLIEVPQVNNDSVPHIITFRQRSIRWPDTYEEGRPFITFNIPENPESEVAFNDTALNEDPIESTAAETFRGGLDFSLKRRERDWVRIGRFYDTPKGQSFRLQQTALQLMQPRVNAPQKDLGDLVGGQLNTLSFGLFGLPDPNQLVYNGGLNTRTSAIMAGIASIPRAGLIPGQHFGYDDVTKRSLWQKNDGEGAMGGDDDSALTHKDGNRLVFLQREKISDGNAGSLGLFGNVDMGGNFGKILGFLTGNGEELFSYLGGPRSKLGIGRTTHFRYTNTTVDNYARKFLGPDLIQANMAAAYPSSSISVLSGRSINYLIGTGQPYYDYSKEIIKDGETRTYHRESRVGLGNPGRRLTPKEKKQIKTDKGEIKYSLYLPDKIDKINALDVHKVTDGKFSGFPYRDMIRFRFEAIDNDTPEGEDMHSDTMVFRAFLDDLSDNFAAEHNNFKYNGRGEEFYTYKGFKRSISLSFKIAAQSRHEMMPLYRKLNFLVSNTAPDYHPDSGRMRTPYMRMTVGHWMNRTPGVLNSVNLKWQKDYPWEINIDGPEEVDDSGLTQSQMLILPHVLDVSVSFTPIHNFLPQKGVKTPFILPQLEDGYLSQFQQWLKKGSEAKTDNNLLSVDTMKPQKEQISGNSEEQAESKDERKVQPYNENISSVETSTSGDS